MFLIKLGSLWALFLQIHFSLLSFLPSLGLLLPICWYTWWWLTGLWGIAHFILFSSLVIRLDSFYWSKVYWSNCFILQGPRLFPSLTQYVNMWPTWLLLKETRGQESSSVLWDVYIISLYVPLCHIIPYCHDLTVRTAVKFPCLYSQYEANGINLIKIQQYLCYEFLH